MHFILLARCKPHHSNFCTWNAVYHSYALPFNDCLILVCMEKNENMKLRCSLNRVTRSYCYMPIWQKHHWPPSTCLHPLLFREAIPVKQNISKSNILKIICNELFKILFNNKIVPELSDPPSGLPLEYIVASFPSKINLNHPLLPFESSKAAASLQIYRQSLPLIIDQSLQW